jgi:hypothetical protein
MPSAREPRDVLSIPQEMTYHRAARRFSDEDGSRGFARMTRFNESPPKSVSSAFIRGWVGVRKKSWTFLGKPPDFWPGFSRELQLDN